MTNRTEIARLRAENEELRAELEELYKEPVWFDELGDYMVIAVVLLLVAFGVFYAMKIF